MELTNDFRVGVGVPVAWEVLNDVERIAPLLPGAQLQEVEDGEYRGVVKVKVGPITAQYRGKATFVEQDRDAGRVVLRASGRDTRGQGNASATITATMVPDGEGTQVKVVTDLTITGKVAQFGRGILAEVSAKLVSQFVDALEADLAGTSAPAPATLAAEEPADVPAAAEELGAPLAARTDGAVPAGPRSISSPAPVPVDLLDAAGSSLARRMLPVAAGAAVIVVVLALRRARRQRRRRRQLRLAPRLAANLSAVRQLPQHLPSVPALPTLPTLKLSRAQKRQLRRGLAALPDLRDLTRRARRAATSR